MKREPFWLTLKAVLAMHEQLVAAHGGDAEVRNLGLLDSALAAPRHHYAYGERDIFVLASAYATASHETIRSSTATNAPPSSPPIHS